MKGQCWVYTDKENGWIDAEKVEFLGIEEGLYGDVMSFEYNGRDYSSQIVFGSKPG